MMLLVLQVLGNWQASPERFSGRQKKKQMTTTTRRKTKKNVMVVDRKSTVSEHRSRDADCPHLHFPRWFASVSETSSPSQSWCSRRNGGRLSSVRQLRNLSMCPNSPSSHWRQHVHHYSLDDIPLYSDRCLQPLACLWNSIKPYTSYITLFV